MATPDEILLLGEIRRALARLRAVRELVQQLRAQGTISSPVADRLTAAAKFDRDEG